jgi:hypothetical protein
MGIDLHIDELVLHGFAARDRHRIAEAMQRELARLITADGQANFLKYPLSLGGINGGEFNVQANAKPQAAGTEIARAVYRSLCQPAKAAAIASRTQPGKGGHQA